MNELRDYPVPGGERAVEDASEEEHAGIVVPLQLNTDAGVLAFFSRTTVFGTPVDITLSELAIESFFPADADTAAVLGRMAVRQT